jgi:hypothetical protein
MVTKVQVKTAVWIGYNDAIQWSMIEASPEGTQKAPAHRAGMLQESCAG